MKGRTAKGERNGSANLTEEKVRAIRQAFQRERQTVLAARFGVTQACVSLIVRRRHWTHIED